MFQKLLTNNIFMKKIYNHLDKYLLLFLCFFLPLGHSNLPEMFHIQLSWQVSGNYEFSKVMLFHIISGIIIFLWFAKKLLKKKKVIIPKIIICILWVLFISNIVSSYPLTSFFWNTSKSHWTLLFIGLINLYVILVNTKKQWLEKYVYTFICSTLFVSIIGIKEYYYPSFDYGNLSNRAISTLWHPNYLALFILMILPFITKIPYTIRKFIIWILLLFTLILTKSLLWISLWIFYLLYTTYSSLFKKIHLTWKLIIFSLSIVFILYILFTFWYVTKLHSFLSRFFIWETTLKTIFLDVKIFLVWWGLWSLEFVFDSFKSPYLYIFENFWFTADRPHNLFLNIFYHLWIIWIALFLYILYQYKKNYQNTPYYQSILLFLIFTFFNFPSIAHYIFLILIIAIIYKKNSYSPTLILENSLLKGIPLSISIISISFWIIYYSSEIQVYRNWDKVSKNKIIQSIQNENYEKKLFVDRKYSREIICQKAILFSPSVENYFHCGNILWKQNQNIAIQYYQDWLQKLPDLWNNNSQYYRNPIIKHFVDGKRFFSEKYSNINEILQRVWE